MPWRSAFAPRSLDPRLGLMLSIGGYVFLALGVASGFTVMHWPFPGGDTAHAFEPAGEAFRTTGSPYVPNFFYGPPWGVILGAVSAIGYGAIHAVVIVLDMVALWAIAGRSWLRAGWLMWIPLVVTEIGAGQLNLLCAAAIVEAQRGTTWPLALMSWAKLWPALALPIRYWRAFLLAVLGFGLLSLPWLDTYPAWIAALMGNLPNPGGPVVPVPFLLRLPVALALIAWRRPWSRALGAMLASPNLYIGQLVVLVAPLSLYFRDGQRERS
jgi:hypothetical protein